MAADDIVYLRHKGQLEGLLSFLEQDVKYNVDLSKIENFKHRIEELLTINQNFLRNEYFFQLEILSFIIRVQELILKLETTAEEKQELRERLTSLLLYYTPRKDLWLNGHAITNAHKIKDEVTAEQIRDVFIRNEPSGYLEILNSFKAKKVQKKSKSLKKVQKKSKSLKKVQKKSKN
jgi:hypothetical protein